MEKKPTRKAPVKKTAVKKPVKPAVQKEMVAEQTLEQIESEFLSGLGDVIKKVTNFIGIPTCDACEERRKKLNSMFPFIKNAKTLSDDEIQFLKRIRFSNTIGSEDRNFLFSLYNKTFSSRVNTCNCPSVVIEMREKLWNVYLADYSKNINDI